MPGLSVPQQPAYSFRHSHFGVLVKNNMGGGACQVVRSGSIWYNSAVHEPVAQWQSIRFSRFCWDWNMKVCSRCGQAKEADEFATRRTKKQPWCKECNRAYARLYYQDNRAKLLQDINKLKTDRRLRSEQYIIEYLLCHPCLDCGENDPVVLEFDHVRGTKREIISMLVSQGYTLTTLAAEIAKCEVVCANCHRRRTAKRGNFYKVKYTQSEVK